MKLYILFSVIAYILLIGVTINASRNAHKRDYIKRIDDNPEV